MPFCKDCGKPIESDSKFCPNCGAPNVLLENKDENEQISQNTETALESKTMKHNGVTSYGAYRLEDLPEGFVIDDRYKVKKKLGQGGFGAVYLVFDIKMDIDKALKIIPDNVSQDKEAMNDLRSEARTMVSLNHKNIVRVYDVHDSGSIKYIDMEYITGKSLNEIRLEYEGKILPEEDARKITIQIAEGLSYAHEQGVIHKDIKPQNIMITEENAVKIMDFGISETLRTSMSRVANTSSSGTLLYMSPEQLRGDDVGKGADIYSFGAVYYELLAGHPPFYKGAVEYQILNNNPKPIDGASNKLNGLILKCLNKIYTYRYKTFTDIIKILNGDMPDTTKNKVVEDKLSKTVIETSNDSFYKDGSFTAKMQPEKQYPKPIVSTNSYSRENNDIKKIIKKIFLTILFIVFAIICFFVIGTILSNYTIPNSEYSVDATIWGHWEEGKAESIQLQITNNSNFTMISYKGRVDIFDNSGNVINGGTFSSHSPNIPSEGARKIEAYLNIQGLSPQDEWTWKYSLEIKGSKFE